MATKKIELPNEEATLLFAKKLVSVIDDVHLITLSGELGAGKTTFVRGFLRALNYQGTVKSPTYTFVEAYDLSRQIVHFDFYRLTDPNELIDLGVEDYFGGEALCLVEWPERVEGWLPASDIDINLQVQDYGRIATLKCSDEKLQQSLRDLFL